MQSQQYYSPSVVESALSHYCYESRLLGLDNEITLYRVFTRELDRELFVQTSLPFILLPMVCARYCAPYPK